jgi:NAD(P) transhydrogenase subunit beta
MTWLVVGVEVPEAGTLAANVLGGIGPHGLYAGLWIGATLLGVLLVIPIGGADMPVVVSLLNSYSGLAASAAGFVLGNNVLIISGALVGASGLILTRIMCRAMNRSLANVVFGAFGQAPDAGGGAGEVRTKADVNAAGADDVAMMLAYASKVVIVPGYGLAVAQAQHKLRELADHLSSRGVQVRYAIHPVAGRMPGHMNVLLAEANVPYTQLYEVEDINPDMPSVDACLVVGANDTVNPAARDDPGSPIAGMPIVEADRAKHTIVLKRSLSPGFAGIDNELFYRRNTMMLFGDAADSIAKLVEEVKAL